LLKNGYLLRFPHPSSLQRTAKYASLLGISGALHLALFEQSGKDDFFSILLEACFQTSMPDKALPSPIFFFSGIGQL
jgi:hypothetical protein